MSVMKKNEEKNQSHLIDLYKAGKMKYNTMITLVRKELNTLQDVASCSRNAVAAIPGIGKKGMQTIEELMAHEGLRFEGRKYLV